jgi:hypothetical protein
MLPLRNPKRGREGEELVKLTGFLGLNDGG